MARVPLLVLGLPFRDMPEIDSDLEWKNVHSVYVVFSIGLK